MGPDFSFSEHSLRHRRSCQQAPAGLGQVMLALLRCVGSSICSERERLARKQLIGV